LDTEEEIEDDTEPAINNEIKTDEEATEIIPVIEEDMEVHKKEVPTGGVRVRSRIIEKPVEENLRLREEHIHVERRKVDRRPTDEELKNFKNQSTEFTEHAEVPEVEKTPKVVEEVRVQKDIDHRNETVRDKVQRKDVDVENIDNEIDEP
jgi:stress response protein YsnF